MRGRSHDSDVIILEHDVYLVVKGRGLLERSENAPNKTRYNMKNYQTCRYKFVTKTENLNFSYHVCIVYRINVSVFKVYIASDI